MVSNRAGTEVFISSSQIHSFFFSLTLPTYPFWRPIDFSLESRVRMLWPKEGTVMVEISGTVAGEGEPEFLPEQIISIPLGRGWEQRWLIGPSHQNPEIFLPKYKLELCILFQLLRTFRANTDTHLSNISGHCLC